MSEPTEPTIFNAVSLNVTPFGAYALACRVCGALVLDFPPDYADQHIRWHEAQTDGAK